MMIIKLFRTNFPNNFVDWTLMINFNWKITSIIISSKFWLWDISLSKSSANWIGVFEYWLFFQSGRSFTTSSLSLAGKFIYNSSSLWILVNGCLLLDWDFFNFHEFNWIVTKRRMRILWCIFITPRLVVFIRTLC